MYSIVKPLREKGKKRSNRDIANDLGYCGDLMIYRVAAEPILELSRRLEMSSHTERLLPLLHRPVLIGMRTGRMRIEGWEEHGEGDKAQVFMQEWAIEFRL